MNFILFVVKFIFDLMPGDATITCRDRNNLFRHDGGLCFEIPPWQHKPVELESHMHKVEAKWGPFNGTISRRQTASLLGMGNNEITRYIDTVIAPFLDTYHRNIQNSYQLMTTKILGRIKEEVNAAVKKKQSIYKELSSLADELKVPTLCDEERRSSKTIANSYVAQIHACTEEARSSIAMMGKYAERMIAITRNHLQQTIGNLVATLNSTRPLVTRTFSKSEIVSSLEALSTSAVNLAYELDLALSNAKRHNEQSCEKLTGCTAKAKKKSEENVAELRDLLYQCVYT